MPVNPHFQHWSYLPEQNLISDLVSESIQIMGMDVHYIPRDAVNIDTILGEDADQTFTKQYTIEVYLEKDEGLQTLPVVIKLGLDLPKTVRAVTAKTRFSILTPLNRPREGDIIYIPLTKTLYEISGVNEFEHLYPAGVLPSWFIDLESFKFSHEPLETGVEDVDAVDDRHDDSANLEGILNEDNSQIEVEDDDVVDRTESSPFGTV